MTRRALIYVLGGTVIVIGAASVVTRVVADRDPVRVGLLHSLSGNMAVSERSLVDAERLAIDEINARGGVLGRQVIPVVADGRSQPATFAAEAERLIRDEHVAALFGVWTSAARKSVRPVVERYHHLLFYPLQYEGLEESPNIVYLGATPNQQIIPALRWVLGTIGRRIFLVGSDYVFPRAAHAIVRDQARKWRAEIVGEEYIAVNSLDANAVVRHIAEVRPGVVLNTLNGAVNVAFFQALKAAGLDASVVPVVSFSIAEDELRGLPAGVMAGHYAAWTYFQSVDTPENHVFVGAFKKKYGSERVTDDPIEAAYMSVRLWARSVEAAGTIDVDAVRRAVPDRSLSAPGGMLYVDRDNRHAWKTVRIGRIKPDGQFEIVWSSGHPVRPEPYPSLRSRAAWDQFLAQLSAGWGGLWENHGAAVRAAQ